MLRYFQNKELIQEIDRTPYKAFLYSEENFISEIVNRLNGKSYYISSLEILHYERVSTGLINAKQKKGCKLHICGSGDRLPFKGGYFFTVFSNSVLEHINIVEPVFDEVKRILNDTGIFIITVPNDNFTKNLSMGRFLNWLGLKNWAKSYQHFFNKISRHYHPDPISKWEERLGSVGFEIIKSWNYFPKASLKILEWGHLFGIPSWLSKKIFGKWILIPSKWNLWVVSVWLKRHYLLEQESPEGAYTFFISKKIGSDAGA